MKADPSSTDRARGTRAVVRIPGEPPRIVPDLPAALDVLIDRYGNAPVVGLWASGVRIETRGMGCDA